MTSEAFTVATAELGSVEAQWEDLAARTQASPFLHPGWTACWWRAFGRGRLCIRTVTSADDGRLAAVLPLRLHQGALTSPTNWHSAELGVLADCDEARSLLIASLFSERRRRVSVAFVDGDDASRLAERGAAEGYRVIRRTIQRSPYVELDGGWQAYERTVDGKVRRELRRRHKVAESRGDLVLEISAGQRLDALLEEGFEVEASGWKGRNGSAIAASAPVRRFYAELARWAAFNGWLHLAFLRLDGKAIAFDYTLEHRGVHYLLKTGYDAAYRELAPGKLLRLAMLRRAFDAGLRRYELLGADEPWKLEWTRTVRAREIVQAFRPTPAGVIDWSAFAFGRPIAKRVRDLVRAR